MDREDYVSEEKNIFRSVGDQPQIDYQDANKTQKIPPNTTVFSSNDEGRFSILSRDNEVLPPSTQKQMSLTKPNDIFKRTGSSFHTQDIMSPSLQNADRMTTNNSILNSCKDKDGGTMNFDDHINQQRDAYLFEKME